MGDVNINFSDNIDPKDSIVLLNSYVNIWVKNKLMMYKSQENLTNREGEFHKLIEDYKYSLYVNAYKEMAVKQHLDTLINDSDIDEYYLNNKSNFKLNEDLFRFSYIHIGHEVSNDQYFVDLFTSPNKSDRDTLVELELELKATHFNDSVWYGFAHMKNIAYGFSKYNKGYLKRNKHVFTRKDSLGIFLLKINEVVERNKISPQKHISSTIKMMILHKRKIELIKKIEQTLIDDAKKKKQFEIY